MLAIVLVALVSVLIPLSLCVVPSFARYTVFPLLSALIHRFTSAYVLPTLQVEILFGSFDVRGKAKQIRETLSGITISLLQIQLQPEFLKSLALEKKGVAPVSISDVTIKEVSVHVGTPWRVVIDINTVDVHAHMIDPNAEALVEAKDALALKIGDAAMWITRFAGQKTKEDQNAAAAQLPEAQRVFGFKDRVMQLVVAQIDIQVRDVNVVVDAPSRQATSGMLETRVRVGIEELEVYSTILHENIEQGRELVVMSSDIRESHKIRIEDFAVTVGDAAEKWKGDALQDDQDQAAASKAVVTLLSVPSLELNLEVPPMARLLGLVPNYAPIPLEKRVAGVQLLLPASNRIVFEKAALVRVLQDAFVPYSDYQVVLKNARTAEADLTARDVASADDITFYLDTFKKVETDTKLAAAEKATLQEKLLQVEAKLTLNELIKLRMKSLGLDVYFRGADSVGVIGLEECITLGNDLNVRPENIMFDKMEIALRLESIAVEFQENRRSLAEFTLCEFGVNMNQFTLAYGDEKVLREIEMTLEQVVFGVMPAVVSTVGPAESPVSKILYADFTRVTVVEDATTRPQQITAKVKQFESGKQIVVAGLRGVQIVAAAHELQYFLLYVDRLSTETGQAMAMAKPMPTLPPIEADPATPPSTPSSAQLAAGADLAPFALLGGMVIDVDLLLDGCRILLLPSTPYEGGVDTEIDYDSAIEHSTRHGMGKSRVEIPIGLHLVVASSKQKELVQLEVTKLGLIARYVDGVASEEDDTDYLLAPAKFSFAHELEADKADPLTNCQKLSVIVPDLVMSFSDLSLTLMSSCANALSGIQTTTPDHAQQRLEMRLKQDEERKQAEIDAVVERIRRMFDEIDVDKSGHIELGELLVLLRRAKVADSLLERELEYFVRVLFKEIDRDGNGYIDFEELRMYLRQDLLSGGSSMAGATGSGELDGSLNLRGGEYASLDEFEKLSGGVKPTTRAQMEEIVMKPFFSGRFFDLYESETHATKATLNGQRALDVQKKLIRLLGHYEAAELCWNLLINPELPTEEKSDWLVQVSMYCGGVSEYQSAAKVIARQQTDTIFSTALRDAEEKMLIVQSSPDVKKKLKLSTDIKLGNLRFVLTDPELPVHHSRGFFAIQHVKLSADMSATDIGVVGPVDWFAVATSDASEWTALFGVRIQAMSYTDLGNAMEDIIEPWELVAAVSSSFKENGVAVLVEAEKRFQINITPGLLNMYRALNDVIGGNQTQASWKKHKDAFRTGLIASNSENTDCVLENSTGCNLVVVVGDQRVEVRADQRAFTKLNLAADGSTTIDAVELEAWGHTKEATILPSFGVKNVRIASDSSPGVELFVTVYCRLEDPARQRIVFKSNVFVSNHSSQMYELKYMTIGTQERPSITSEVLHLNPSERTALPLSVLMGITEIYARPVHYNDWIVKATLNDDLVTSPAAIRDIEEYDKAMKATLQQRRGAIVYGETQENNSKVIKQLSPGVILRRWHLRSNFEWEMSVLPPFVVRNSLPYKIDYRFVEYKVKSGNVAADFDAIEASLKATDDQLAANVISGSVSSGHDAEITGISCFAPGYLCIRIVNKPRDEAAPRVKSAWSKPLLMAIHSTIDQFTIARETVELEAGLAFSMDRLTAQNLPRLVRFSCPYWIVNNTSLDLAIASAAPGAKTNSLQALSESKDFVYPRMTSLEHDRVSIKPIAMIGKRPSGWTTLGKVPPSAYSPNGVTDGALKAATWSEPMNSTTVNTIGELSCGPSVFGVKIEGLYGSFEQSIALTVSPRFYLQNRLKEKIFVQAFASGEAAESADNLFRTKRTPEEAKASMVSISTGETTPMYHFFPLKKNEALASQSQKYISLSFEDTMGETWSHVIPVSTAGDAYIQLHSKTRDRQIICMASVQVIDMYVYVILSDTSGSPPYRIENFTPYQIECSQIAEESSLFKKAATDSNRTIKHGEWYAFAWSNSLSKQHRMQMRLHHPDGRTKDKKYDIDAVGYHESIILEQAKTADGNVSERVEIIVQTVVDEGTRVLKFLSKELEMQRLENQDAQFEQEFEQRKMTFASSFDIRIAGLGLSLFDTLPQEVFFLSVDVVQIQKLPGSLQWNLSIFHSQIDNMLPNAKFPVILNPLNAGFSDKTAGKPPQPIVSFVLDADLTAKVGIYKLLEFELSSVGLKVDLDYIVNLVKLVEPFLASDSAMLNASLETLDRVLRRQVPPVPAAELTADGNIRHNVLYFDLLRIGPLSVDLEYSITRKDIVSNAGGGNSVIFGLITQVVGLIGSNLSGSPTLSFSEIVIQRCFSTKDRLQSQLIQNFVRQAVMQAYRLIGSADIIGDPIGLVEDLGSGVVEFFKITKGELMGDSQTRGEGVKVLGKTVAQTGASTLAKFTGSLDKFVGDFSQEDEAANAAGNEEKADTHHGGGGFKFAKDLGKGLTGIFTKPVEGAMKGGVTGLLSGTVQGIAGPGVVLLKQITSTSHNIALGVQSTVVDRSPFGGRRRLSKKVEGNRVVADFDEKHYRPTRLFLEVVSAQGLLAGDSCDPKCVVRVDEKPILSTHVLYNTLNPVWQEKTQIELTGAEQEIQFVVKDSYGGAVARTVGKCAVSMDELQDDFRPPQFSSSLAQWVRTGEKPEETKKNVSNVVKEKDYTLYVKNEGARGASKAIGSATAMLGLGGSTKVKLSADDVQVLVTVSGLRDLKITSSSGGGMLGLGNLVSSTPNISPFVSVHVGKGTQRTHVAKMTFAGSGAEQKGQAQWNESFTFAVVKKEMDGTTPAVLLSLKDKSMLHDETLGFAQLPLSLVPTRKPLEQDVEVHANKDGSGPVIGYLKLKVEVIGATATSAATGVPGSPKVGTPKAGGLPSSLPAGQRESTFRLDADVVKAGKIRVACEFV